MMNVLAISDLHGHLPEIPKCDLLLLGGDYNDKINLDQQERFMLGPFKEWLESIDARHIVGIAGNHDFILKEKHLDLPWTYLQDAAVNIEGVRIYGTPWTPTFGAWAFMRPEAALRDIFDLIPAGLDILLSHGPVMGILDKVISGQNVGSRESLYKVKVIKPDNFVCGHIHEARGIYDSGDTRFYNVAYVNEVNEPVGHPVNVTLRA